MAAKGTNAYGAFSEPELYMGFLRGYRGWSMVSDLRRVGEECEYVCWPHCGKAEHMVPLRSVYISRHSYKPGVNVAECAHDSIIDLNPVPTGHPAPTAECTCGFYATHYGFPGEYLNRPILGTVKGSGRILVGDTGFRAEKVEIEALAVGYDVSPEERPKFFEALKILGNYYNVPVFGHPTLLLEAFPPTEIDGLGVPPTPEDFHDWPITAGFVTNQGVVQLRRSPEETIPVRAVLINEKTRAVTQVPVAFGFTLTDGERVFLIRWMTFSFVVESNNQRVLESSSFVTTLDHTLDDATTVQLSESWQRAWQQLDAEIRAYVEHRAKELKADSASYIVGSGLR